MNNEKKTKKGLQNYILSDYTFLKIMRKNSCDPLKQHGNCYNQETKMSSKIFGTAFYCGALIWLLVKRRIRVFMRLRGYEATMKL